jgi:hypothetical protein
MALRPVVAVLLLSTLAGCAGSSVGISKADDLAAELDASGIPDVAADASPDLGPLPDLTPAETADVEPPQDFFVPDQAGCAPGEGCFLDPCTSNAQCQSGWCVEHLGEGVCSTVCVEDCPPGWTCRQVGSDGPDVQFVCVSDYSNLCKPCASNADCKAPGGADDVCVAYGSEGSFCGGACGTGKPCPWGFSCKKALTAEGVELFQCISDTGSCPCTGKSVSLALATPCTTSNEFGTCAGSRVCLDTGLTPCDAAEPQQETCNGDDDDCDGQADEPEEVGGDFVNLCDDDNQCTKDVCSGKDGCTHESLLVGECMDGDPCTKGDHCEQGVCVGLPIDCDDGNPCTDHTCDELGGCLATPNAAQCDDGDPCTVGDHCSQGSCAGTPVACECNGSDQDCEQLWGDDNLCNGTLECDTGVTPFKCKIKPGSAVLCPDITGPAAECNKAVCDPATGACGMTPAFDGLACSDGNACTVGDACEAGQCSPGTGATCSDANPCTTDACDPETGCVFTPNTLACDDGNPCTLDDQCQDGVCAFETFKDCEDGNPCTDNACDPAVGCVATFNSSPCDDADACTFGDHCKLGACVGGQSLPCNDGNPCTDDSCDPALGCVHSTNAAACDDGNPCTVGDQCKFGGCVGGKALACNDNNPCTDDSCDPVKGCIGTPNAAPCDDGNPCTLGDTCKAGACTSTGIKPCDDGNVCTDDKCDPAKGCVSTPNTAPCDDNDLCTFADHCNLGMCIGGQKLPCNDNNPCTDDSCDPKAGCQFLPNTAQCSDGNACTVGDACQNGQCVVTGMANCDDGLVCNGSEKCDPAKGCVPGTPPTLTDNIACTFDYCDEAAGGVVHAPQDAACADNKFCNGVETCVADMGCAPGIQVPVDDNVKCTVDACDEDADKVTHTPVDQACGNQDVCDGIETCNALSGCQNGTPLTCNDNVACTSDSCDKVTGCAYTPVDAQCNDGNTCTTDTCQLVTGCLFTPLPNNTQCTSGSGPGKCQGGTCVPDCQAGSKTFDHTASGTTFQVPSGCSTTVTIEAWGAEGGMEEAGIGGKGARMKGSFSGLSGKTLEIRVGGKGAQGTCSLCGGGGGGGSFVWIQGAADPLLIAGGGGGASYQGNPGQPGLTSQQSGPGGYSPPAVGQGGYSDNGGGGGTGAGGGGWLSDGTGNIWTTGGAAKGGPGGVSKGYTGNGGFGGGGGSYHGGGGGGGYSGGSGGTYTVGGGGGGSYNGGNNLGADQGVRNGNGQIVISWQ